MSRGDDVADNSEELCSLVKHSSSFIFIEKIKRWRIITIFTVGFYVYFFVEDLTLRNLKLHTSVSTFLIITKFPGHFNINRNFLSNLNNKVNI